MKVIAPHTVIRLKKREDDWDTELHIGDQFRIGYYRKQDGLDCVWLVNTTGEYEQTWDHQTLLDYFEVVAPSDETDLYGVNRPQLESLV